MPSHLNLFVSGFGDGAVSGVVVSVGVVVVVVVGDWGCSRGDRDRDRDPYRLCLRTCLPFYRFRPHHNPARCPCNLDHRLSLAGSCGLTTRTRCCE